MPARTRSVACFSNRLKKQKPLTHMSLPATWSLSTERAKCYMRSHITLLNKGKLVNRVNDDVSKVYFARHTISVPRGPRARSSMENLLCFFKWLGLTHHKDVPILQQPPVRRPLRQVDSPQRSIRTRVCGRSESPGAITT
jgi:hypothetical protein